MISQSIRTVETINAPLDFKVRRSSQFVTNKAKHLYDSDIQKDMVRSEYHKNRNVKSLKFITKQKKEKQYESDYITQSDSRKQYDYHIEDY